MVLVDVFYITIVHGKSQMYDISLSVVMVAYNESACIKQVIEETIQILEENYSQYELIIVNDGSSDNTGEIADKFAALNKNVSALHHAHNQGIDNSLKTGFAKAKYDYVSWLPADGQVEAKEILKFMPKVKSSDLVLSVYTHRPDHPIRLFISRSLRKLIQLVIGFDMKNESIYVIKRQMLKSLKLNSNTIMIQFEIPAKVARKNGVISSVVIDAKPRIAGKSKVANLRTMWKTFINLLKLRFIYSLK